jgi:formylglycine-generating enzyme required for sulfatase activity
MNARGAKSGKTIDLGSGVSMEFVLIPAGSFYMGSPSDEKDRYSDEGPVRRVQITKSFLMGKFEVTQDQFNAVMGRNPSYFSGRDLPVETVEWLDATQFCEKLSARSAGHFRLPTEAEWEYACRGGSETRFHYGDDPNYTQFGEYAWYAGNSEKKTHSVGQKKPNQFGLHDMHGNVGEWYSDYYAKSYQNLTSIDPTGPKSGSSHVFRGGCWGDDVSRCRVAYRGSNLPPVGRYLSGYGFRVVLDLQ